MKIKCFIITIFCLIGITTICQEKPQIIIANDVLQKGFELYEAEKYEDALKEFQKIPENDTAYYTAVVEQILSYYQLKKFEEGIAVGKKALDMNLYLSPELFLNIGSCYDNLEKYEEAIKLYDQGIKVFPKQNLLIFNKGYSFLKQEKFKEAFECFKKSAELNPFHSRTHYALGTLAMKEGNTTLAMLAFSTFILLDPSSPFANNALVNINEMASSKYQEDTKPSGIDITDGDDFSDIDILIQNYIALDKKYKVKSKLKLPFIKQNYLIFEKIPENPDNKGFWYRTYVPFYKQLLKDDKFDLFATYLLLASANENHKKIIEKNKSKLISFVDWIRETWDNKHRTCEMEFNGKIQNVNVFRANKRFAISSIGVLNDAKTDYYGYSELYHDNGKLKAFGKYNNEGKKDGEWIWYNNNGTLKAKEVYNNGELNLYDEYSFIGIIETHIPFKKEKIDGNAIVYTNVGAKSKLITFKDNTEDGNYEEYYSNGQILLKGISKKGKLEGLVKTFYSSGELKSEVNYLEGEKNLQEVYYFRNGKILQKANYTKGLLQGDFASYYENGQIADSIKYLNDKAIGKNIKFYKNGMVSEIADFDENGKINGIWKEFDTDGKIYFESEYKKGEIIGYKYYNKKGDIIKQDKKKSGNFDFEGFYSNGIKKSMGKYGKEEMQGEWKYYDRNGNIESITSYIDGKAQGETKRFFSNGKVEKLIQYKDDLAEGYFVEYYKNGNIYSHGNYKNDELEGNWVSYNLNKSLSSENYYIGGLPVGTQKYYAVNGKLIETKSYYEGILLNLSNYDTLGQLIDKIDLINSSGKIIYHFFKEGPVKCELNILFNNYQNDYVFYYPNGKTNVKGQYFNGEKNGAWIWYYWNGNIKTKGYYEYGDETGKWEYYNEDGKLYRAIEYEDGKTNGKDIFYYENGVVELERNYVDDLLEGTSHYYTSDGQLEHKRQFLHDQLISYTYSEPNGTEKTIEIANETAEIKIYFKNGKIARKFTLDKGISQGEYNRYYSTGQIYEKCPYVDDDALGENIYYFPNGKIKEKRNYENGALNGIKELYYPDGKLKETSNYLFGKAHGKCHKYDKTGKLIAVLTYYNDDIIAISDK